MSMESQLREVLRDERVHRRQVEDQLNEQRELVGKLQEDRGAMMADLERARAVIVEIVKVAEQNAAETMTTVAELRLAGEFVRIGMIARAWMNVYDRRVGRPEGTTQDDGERTARQAYVDELEESVRRTGTP